MPKVSEEYRTARREEILDAAARAIARGGYRGTSMAEIIEESGLSAGAIYGHFSSKQELFIAVAERVLAGRRQDLDDARVDGAPLSPSAMMRAIIGGFRTEKIAAIVPQVWAEAAVDPELAGVARRILAEVRALVEGELTAWASAEPGRVDGEPSAWARRVAPVVIAAAPGFLVQRVVMPDFDEDSYLAALDEIYRH